MLNFISVDIAKNLAASAGFKSKAEGDRFIYWNGSDIFSTMITDGLILSVKFMKDIGR